MRRGRADLLLHGFQPGRGSPGALPAGLPWRDRRRHGPCTRRAPPTAAAHPGAIRLRFDLLPPQANTPPLELRLSASAPAEPVAWQIQWAISDDPARTGLVLERLENGAPVAISSLIPGSFGSWVTGELALQPLTSIREAVLLRVTTTSGEKTAL